MKSTATQFFGTTTILWLLLLLDAGYTFAQFFHQTLDGDMPAIILPAEHYQPVLDDAFGLRAALHGEHYASPNRHFCHASMTAYFRHVPQFLQAFASPVDSVYLATALAKLFCNVLILWLLAKLVARFSTISALATAVLLAPLFQANGYNGSMGIVQDAPTYAWFYALPTGLLLWFFAETFFRDFARTNPGNSALNWARIAALAILAVCLPLSGPLVPAVSLLGCAGFWAKIQWENGRHGWHFAFDKNFKINLFLGLTLCLSSLYSISLNRFNTENPASPPSLAECYEHLFSGIFDQLTIKLGLPLLLVFVGFNLWTMRRSANLPARPLLHKFGWLGIFCLAYLALLPFGGYREYRPGLLRGDTMLPITIALFWIFGTSTVWLFNHFSGRKRRGYSLAVAAFWLIFLIADKPEWGKNRCERAAIQQLADTPAGQNFQGKFDCPVLDWLPRDDLNFSSEKLELLKRWGIVSQKR